MSLVTPPGKRLRGAVGGYLSYDTLGRLGRAASAATQTFLSGSAEAPGSNINIQIARGDKHGGINRRRVSVKAKKRSVTFKQMKDLLISTPTIQLNFRNENNPDLVTAGWVEQDDENREILGPANCTFFKDFRLLTTKTFLRLMIEAARVMKNQPTGEVMTFGGAVHGFKMIVRSMSAEHRLENFCNYPIMLKVMEYDDVQRHNSNILSSWKRDIESEQFRQRTTYDSSNSLLPASDSVPSVITATVPNLNVTSYNITVTIPNANVYLPSGTVLTRVVPTGTPSALVVVAYVSPNVYQVYGPSATTAWGAGVVLRVQYPFNFRGIDVLSGTSGQPSAAAVGRNVEVLQHVDDTEQRFVQIAEMEQGGKVWVPSGFRVNKLFKMKRVKTIILEPGDHCIVHQEVKGFVMDSRELFMDYTSRVPVAEATGTPTSFEALVGRYHPKFGGGVLFGCVSCRMATDADNQNRDVFPPAKLHHKVTVKYNIAPLTFNQPSGIIEYGNPTSVATGVLEFINPELDEFKITRTD